jgi:MFS family permease
VQVRERGVAAALFSTYFGVMGAKCALPSVMALLMAPPPIGLDFTSGWWTTPTALAPQQLMARLLTISTLAVAFGKLVLGPVIDTFGGIVSLQISLLFLMVLLATIASSNSFLIFGICWVLVDFIFSSCWAACINAIHQCFPEEEWAGRVGMLAAAARMGNAAAFCIFSGVLHWTTTTSTAITTTKSRPWRLVFTVSAAMQLLPIALLTYFGQFYKKRDKKKLVKDDDDDYLKEVVSIAPSSQKTTSIKSSLVTLKREATTPEFWLHFISRSALTVFGSFLLFIPTLMTNSYDSSSAFAAQVGSIFALGCLSSVTLGSQHYAKMLSKRKQMFAVVLLLGMATCCVLGQLGHHCGVLHLSANASAALLFLMGFSFAIPFYIPPSLYALQRGGMTSSATIADVFDVGGFGLLAIFNGYVASIHHYELRAWIPTFGILTGCSLISMVSLALAIFFEHRK